MGGSLFLDHGVNYTEYSDVGIRFILGKRGVWEKKHTAETDVHFEC